MANQKISELTALLGADVATLDLLPIVDTSAGSTKKITAPELKAYLLGGAVTVTAAGRALLDDADAAAQRTTLGLGTMAVATASDYLTALAAAAAYQPLASVLTNTTASFTTAQETKLGHISVTQAVDLDAIETRVNALDAAVVLKGTWDASAGTFPGSGTAQAGDSYIVSVAGTVGGVAFVANDRILAITDNASTSTYAANWHKLDYTDAVLSVAGRTGAVTLTLADLTDASANGRSLVAAADYAAMRALLDLEAGTDFYSKAAADLAFQPLDSDLTAIAALSTTSFGRGLLTLSAGTETYVLTMSGGAAVWAAASGGGGSPGGSSGQLQYNNASAFAGSLLWQASDVIEQRNSNNPQAFKIYNTYTDPSNYERFRMEWSGNEFIIQAQKAGTGSARSIRIYTGNASSYLEIQETYLSVAGILYSNDFYCANGGNLKFSDGSDYNRGLAAVTGKAAVKITDGSTGGGALGFIEMTAPGAPAANGCYLYVQDNGAGKTHLMAKFATGAAQQVAIEP